MIIEYFICKIDFYLKKMTAKLSPKSSFLAQATCGKLIGNLTDLDTSMLNSETQETPDTMNNQSSQENLSNLVNDEVSN